MKLNLSNYVLCSLFLTTCSVSVFAEKTPYQPFGIKLGTVNELLELPKTHPQFYKSADNSRKEGYPYASKVLKETSLAKCSELEIKNYEHKLTTATDRTQAGGFQDIIDSASILCSANGPGMHVDAYADDQQRVYNIHANVMLSGLGIIGDAEQNKALVDLIRKMYDAYGIPKVNFTNPTQPVNYLSRDKYRTVPLEKAIDLINTSPNVHLLFQKGDVLVKFHKGAYGNRGTTIIQMIDGAIGAQFAAKVKADMPPLLAQRRAELNAIQEQARKKLGL